jgi:succinoglycan biosynthesis transport protein ExoP
MATSKTRVTPGNLQPLSLILIVWRRRWGILAGSLVLAAAAVTYIRRLPDVYTTDAVIIVDSQKIPEKFVASTVQVSLNDSVSAISHQVLSSTRLQKIITDFNLYPQLQGKKTQEELLAKFRDDLDINVERGLGGGRSGAFRISFEGPDAQVVAAVVNRVADLFVQENMSSRERRAEGTSDFLEAQLQQAKQSLEEQERNLSAFKLRWTGELPQQETALLGTLSRLQSEFDANEAAISRAEQNRIVLDNTLRFAESSLSSLLHTAQSPAVLTGTRDNTADTPVVRSSAALSAKLQALQLRYYDDHPEVRRARSELAAALEDEQRTDHAASRSAKKADASAAPALPPSVPANLVTDINRERERIASTNTQIELLKGEIRKRHADSDRLEKEMKQYSVRVDKLPIREQQIASLTRDYETTKANYHSLLDKKISAEMARDMERQQQSERFTITDAARVPAKPVKPKRMLLYAAAAVGSFAMCIAAALGLGLRQNKFLGEWELPPGIPVIGRVYNINSSPALKTTFDYDFSAMVVCPDRSKS